MGKYACLNNIRDGEKGADMVCVSVVHSHPLQYGLSLSYSISFDLIFCFKRGQLNKRSALCASIFEANHETPFPEDER